MKDFNKKTIETIVGIVVLGIVGTTFMNTYKLNKNNKFKNVVVNETNEDDKGTISFNDLTAYHIVELNNNDKHELYIARPNNFNSIDYKIYYNIFDGEDIVGDNEEKVIETTPIEYYLYELKLVKENYSKEDLEKILNRIKENYDYTETKTLTKEK